MRLIDIGFHFILSIDKGTQLYLAHWTIMSNSDCGCAMKKLLHTQPLLELPSVYPVVNSHKKRYDSSMKST